MEEPNSNVELSYEDLNWYYWNYELKREMQKMEDAPLHDEYYNGVHLLLKTYDKQRWREELTL
jgi:hypothetical protein